MFSSAFEGSFDSARPLAELESVIPSSLPLATGLELESENPTSIFAPSAHVIPTPPPESCNLSPASLSHYSPTSSNASDYIKGSSLEESPLSSPGGSGADDLFILPASTKHSLCSPCGSSIVNGGLKEDCASILQLEEHGEDADIAASVNGVFMSETASTGSAQSLLEEDKNSTLPARNGETKKDSRPSSPKSSKQDTVPRNIKLPQSK